MDTASTQRLPRPQAADRAAGDQEDRHLIERVAAGDMAAFERLYERHARRLGGYLWRMLRRSELVDEAVNDVMLVAWQKAETFRPEGRVSTWLFGIAHNKALSLLDKERRHVRDRAAEHDDAESAAERVAAPDPDVEDVVSARIELDDLRQRVATLSDDHRAVVELTFFAGLSYAEIAEILDCPVNTVKTRMFHARKQILRSAA